MTKDASLLGTLHVVDGVGVVRVASRFDVGIDDLWMALTDPDRLVGWFGELEGGAPSPGIEFGLRIHLGGRRVGRVEECEPPARLLVKMSDPAPQPGQPPSTAVEVQLRAEGARTLLLWEERGMPVELLPAYGTGVQIHVEHLADYLGGQELRDVETRWNALSPGYQGSAVK